MRSFAPALLRPLRSTVRDVTEIAVAQGLPWPTGAVRTRRGAISFVLSRLLDFSFVNTAVFRLALDEDDARVLCKSSNGRSPTIFDSYLLRWSVTPGRLAWMKRERSDGRIACFFEEQCILHCGTALHAHLNWLIAACVVAVHGSACCARSRPSIQGYPPRKSRDL